MDEEEIAREEPGRKHKKISPAVKHIFTALITLLLAAAALLCFIYRDELSSDALHSRFGGQSGEKSGITPYSYENGANLCFAAAGDGFAAASSSGIQLLDSSGRTVVKELCSMSCPAVKACRSAALFFDVGGTDCRLAKFDGSCTEIDAGDGVISASINESGSFAVITQDPSCKGLVQVYDSGCSLVYQWYSGTGYALKAELSPDGRQLAVLCTGAQGSTVHILRLNSETELSSFSFEKELLFDMSFISSSELCLVGEKKLYFQQLGGELSSYSFEGRYLSAYELGDGFAAVCLSDYINGSAGSLISIGSGAEELGSAEVSGNLISLSICGKQLLAVSSGGMSLYSQSMQLQKSRDMLVTAKQALLRPKGDVLLLSSYSAELFNF